MTAKEAKELSEKKHLSTEVVLEQIKASAENGNISAQFWIPLGEGVKEELMRMGYKLTIKEDSIGIEFYVCYWGNL